MSKRFSNPRSEFSKRRYIYLVPPVCRILLVRILQRTSWKDPSIAKPGRILLQRHTSRALAFNDTKLRSSRFPPAMTETSRFLLAFRSLYFSVTSIQSISIPHPGIYVLDSEYRPVKLSNEQESQISVDRETTENVYPYASVATKLKQHIHENYTTWLKTFALDIRAV